MKFLSSSPKSMVGIVASKLLYTNMSALKKKSSLYSHSVKENDSIHDIEIVFRSIRVLACTSAQNQGAIMDFCEICPTIQLFSHKPLFKKITKKNCPRNRKEKVAVCFPDVRGKNLTNASLT